MQSLQTPTVGRVALQGFFHIKEKWSLDNQQARVLLGGISKTTFYRYRKLPEVTLQNETIDRILLMSGIYRILKKMDSLDAIKKEMVKGGYYE